MFHFYLVSYLIKAITNTTLKLFYCNIQQQHYTTRIKYTIKLAFLYIQSIIHFQLHSAIHLCILNSIYYFKNYHY